MKPTWRVRYNYQMALFLVVCAGKRLRETFSKRQDAQDMANWLNSGGKL